MGSGYDAVVGGLEQGHVLRPELIAYSDSKKISRSAMDAVIDRGIKHSYFCKVKVRREGRGEIAYFPYNSELEQTFSRIFLLAHLRYRLLRSEVTDGLWFLMELTSSVQSDSCRAKVRVFPYPGLGEFELAWYPSSRREIPLSPGEDGTLIIISATRDEQRNSATIDAPDSQVASNRVYRSYRIASESTKKRLCRLDGRAYILVLEFFTESFADYFPCLFVRDEQDRNPQLLPIIEYMSSGMVKKTEIDSKRMRVGPSTFMSL